MTVTGKALVKAATMVDDGSGVYIAGEDRKFVSRGGLKLEAALDRFNLEVAGLRGIDVGASTGGFTDCLLQRRASSVVALDVGYGQLDWKLRNDDRVTVVERMNIRNADAAALGAPFDIVVADLSFISLVTVVSKLIELGDSGTDYILLVKPQFEAQRSQVGKGGIIRDDEVRVQIVGNAVERLVEFGLGCLDLAPSPIEGSKGNREVIGLFQHGPATVDAATVRQAAL